MKEALDNAPNPLSVGWVEYVENPLTEQQRIVRCPLGAAPGWVQQKHANHDTPTAAKGPSL